MSNPRIDPYLAQVMASSRPPDNALRTGVLYQVDGALVNVLVDGGVVPAGYVSSYLPRVGDTVALMRQDASWLILGAIGGDRGQPKEAGFNGALLYKAGDENRTNSNFVDDAELQTEVVAGGVYGISGVFIYTAPPAAGYKHQWLYPSGEWHVPSYLYDPGTADQQALTATTYPTVGGLTTGYAGTSARVPIWVEATLFVGSTGGKVIYQWGQTTTSGTTTLHKGSRMRVERYA